MTKEEHAAKQLLEQVSGIIKKETDNAEKLLKQVSGEIKLVENQYRDTGSTYNLFKIAGIDNDEEIISKVMADLLNPKGLHYQGNVYLEIFLDEIVWRLIKKDPQQRIKQEHADNFQLAKAKIKLEGSTNEGRFIDITIDDGTIFIPIEAKINAPEQPKQLTDYARFSELMNKRYGFIPVLFLTKDGSPSKEAKDNVYIPISFEKDIIRWLEKCLNLEQTQKIPPVREIIKQLIRTIKSFCGQLEGEEMESAIKNLITENRDNYILAKRIANAWGSIDFGVKALEIFEGQICNLVKNKLSDAVYDKDDDGWQYIAIPIRKDCILSINYNFKYLAITYDNPGKPLPDKTAGKIRETMSTITGLRNEAGDDFVWYSDNAKFPDIGDKDDEDVYNYDLYQIYFKDPQAVANKIVSWVTELRKI